MTSLEQVRDYYRKEFGDYIWVDCDSDDVGCKTEVDRVIVPVSIIIPHHILSPSTFLKAYKASRGRGVDEVHSHKLISHFASTLWTEVLQDWTGGLRLEGWYDDGKIVYPGIKTKDELTYDWPSDKGYNCITSIAGDFSLKAIHENWSNILDIPAKDMQTVADYSKLKKELGDLCVQEGARLWIERHDRSEIVHVFTKDLSENGINSYLKFLTEAYPALLTSHRKQGGILGIDSGLAAAFKEGSFGFKVFDYYRESDIHDYKGLEMIARYMSEKKR